MHKFGGLTHASVLCMYGYGNWGATLVPLCSHATYVFGISRTELLKWNHKGNRLVRVPPPPSHVVSAELTHTVNISGPANPLSAGEKYSLTCTVTFDLLPFVRWLGPGNDEVDGSDVSVRVSEPVTGGNTTTLTLHFDPIRTSHGGTYSCRSSIRELRSDKLATRHVKVQSKCALAVGTLKV